MMGATSRFAAALVVLSAFQAPVLGAPFTLNVVDPPGEGFNDPTPVDPVPGNPGTTLGEQRLNAFVAAAESWGEILASSVPIVVEVEMPELTCTAEEAALGAAGPRVVFRDFSAAPRPSTWYVAALAESLAGENLENVTPEIGAVFNSVLDEGDANCIGGISWWYGVDAPPPQGTIPFFEVVRHELAHGVGFTSFYDRETGEKLNGFDDAYMVFLEDHSNGMTWPEMTNSQRLSSSTDTGDLHWIGPEARALGSSVLTDGRHPSGHLEMYAPDPAEIGSSVTHWTTEMTPDELMEPFTVPGAEDLVTTGLLQDIGWPLTSEGPPPSGDTLTTPEIPGFEFEVTITPAGSSPIPGSAESDCIAETLCVSGALAGRPEIFVKIIGPRPNGFNWVQISRFTPSRVDVTVREIFTGKENFYTLDAVGPGSDDVSGLQDREAFEPQE